MNQQAASSLPWSLSDLLSNLFLQEYFLGAFPLQNRLISAQQSCLLYSCLLFKTHLLGLVRKLKLNHQIVTTVLTAAFGTFLPLILLFPSAGSFLTLLFGICLGCLESCRLLGVCAKAAGTSVIALWANVNSDRVFWSL